MNKQTQKTTNIRQIEEANTYLTVHKAFIGYLNILNYLPHKLVGISVFAEKQF